MYLAALEEMPPTAWPTVPALHLHHHQYQHHSSCRSPCHPGHPHAQAADIMAELGPEGGAEEMLEGAMQAPGTTMPIPTLMQQQGAAAGAHQPQGPLRPASPAAAAAATLASSPRGMTRGPLAGAFEPAPAEAMGLQGPGQGTAGAAGAAAAAAQAATQELEHLADLLDQVGGGGFGSRLEEEWGGGRGKRGQRRMSQPH